MRKGPRHAPRGCLTPMRPKPTAVSRTLRHSATTWRQGELHAPRLYRLHKTAAWRGAAKLGQGAAEGDEMT